MTQQQQPKLTRRDKREITVFLNSLSFEDRQNIYFAFEHFNKLKTAIINTDSPVGNKITKGMEKISSLVKFALI